MKNATNALIKALHNYQNPNVSFNTIVGFDGYLNKIQKIVKSKEEGKSVYYNSITEVAQQVAAMVGSCGNIELRNLELTYGGTAPTLANALGNLGLHNTCIGTMGYPEILSVFEEIHPNCEAVSIAQAAQNNIMEFDDGKLAFSEVSTFEQLTWSYVAAIAGIENLARWIYESQLIAFVNWSSLNHGTDIWKGILNNVIENIAPAQINPKKIAYHTKSRYEISDGLGMHHKHFLFDLGKPSQRTNNAIKEVLDVITQYAAYGKVTLSLTDEDAKIVYVLLKAEAVEVEIATMATDILTLTNIHHVIIREQHNVTVATKKQVYQQEIVLNPKHRIISGAQENFNAGFCLGLLLDLPMAQLLLLAIATETEFLTYGESPNISQLIKVFTHNSVVA